MKIKPGDILILIAAVSFTFFLSFSIYTDTARDKKVYIYAAGKEYIYTLEKEQTIEVSGPLGITEVEIRNNSVCVHSSPCLLKVCEKKGEISRAGDWISCLPNNVLIVIRGESRENDEVDAISQ